jgi:O-antigen ligase
MDIHHSSAGGYIRPRPQLAIHLSSVVGAGLAELRVAEHARETARIVSAASVASALAALGQGRFGGAFALSVRATGFAEAANTAARYFVVAFVFLNYLRTTLSRGPARLVVNGGMVVTFLGVFATVSRTGMMLLFAALGFMVLLRLGAKHRIWLVSTYVVLVTLLFSLSDRVAVILRSIVPSITRGSDTIGLRYMLWQAGWRMWLDNPIAGVGIGQFPVHLAQYAPSQFPPHYLGLVAHNMYIAMLAETGIIGFGLFILLLFTALRYLLRAASAGDPDAASLRNTWLVVFLVMLFGGITKTDQADKLLWLAIGVSVCFHNQLSREREEVSEPSSGTSEELAATE